MILTVTLNTALDLTYPVPRLERGGAHELRDAPERPGGSGVRAARLLTGLGHSVTVAGFAGGTTGTALRDGLARCDGLTDALVPVAGSTRRSLTVLAERPGESTRFDEPGPEVTPEEWAAFGESWTRLLHGRRPDAVALCGSLPRGVPVGAWAQLVRQARAAGVPVVLATGGEPLRRGLAARPDLVVAGARELAGVTGTAEPSAAARGAQRRGARAVAAALGTDGMLLVTGDGTWQAEPPAPLHGDPRGHAAAAVAGLVSGTALGLPWPDRLARAAALASASGRAPAAGDFLPGTYGELLAGVHTRQETAP